MGSIAGARRTQSSYPTFLASTNPSDLTVAVFDPANGGGPGPPLGAKIAHLPGVKRVRDLVAPTFVPLTKRRAAAEHGEPRGHVGQSRRGVRQSRPPHGHKRPAGRPGTSRRDHDDRQRGPAARRARRPGRAARVLCRLADGPARIRHVRRCRPASEVPAKLVGIVTLDNQVVQDDIDRAYGFMVVTPALVREAVALSPVAAAPEAYGLQLDHGSEVSRRSSRSSSARSRRT